MKSPPAPQNSDPSAARLVSDRPSTPERERAARLEALAVRSARPFAACACPITT